MSFLEISKIQQKDLVREYVEQLNMVNQEMKTVNKQTAEETRKELAPTKKTLTDIDVALNGHTDAIPQEVEIRRVEVLI